MTRQKKELNRKIDELYHEIGMNELPAPGMLPASYYQDVYQRIDKLLDQLVQLSHYSSTEEMLHDERGTAEKTKQKAPKPVKHRKSRSER